MGDSFKDFLSSQRRSATAIFHQFRLEVAAGLKSALFVEGFDDKMFYSNFLPAGDFDRDSVRLSFGKKNMDRLVEFYHQHGLEERCKAIFLRDADFDEFIEKIPQSPHLRILDRYSVENFVFTRENLRRLLVEKFGISGAEFDIDSCLMNYEKAVQAIFCHISPVIGGAIKAIKNGMAVNLDGLRVSQFAKSFFANGSLPEISTEHLDAVKIGADLLDEDALHLGQEFVKRDALLWLRGHYLAEVCSEFVKLTHSDLVQKKKDGVIHTLNKSLSSDFSPPALFERLCGICDQPLVFSSISANA